MISEENRKVKNQQIKQTLGETRKRRKSQVCRVFECKLTYRKTNKIQREFLSRIFLEAKWLFNWQLSQEDIFKVDTKVKTIPVKCRETYEQRNLEMMGSQVKQSILERTKTNARALKALKEKGHKVGRIRYTSLVNSIPLKQYGYTHRIKGEKIFFQGCRFGFRAKGLEQIKGLELANATLVRRPSGYYILLTTYGEKKFRERTGKVIGLDFGIKDDIVTSENQKLNWSFDYSKIKKEDRRLGRLRHKNHYKKTSHYFKQLKKRNKAYEKLNNQKKDASNKFCSQLIKDYDIIVIQDELLRNWHKGLFGKQIQYGILGKVKKRLKDNPSTIVLEQSTATTQLCPICHQKTKHGLEKRDYHCRYCDFKFPDRDWKAALTILQLGLLVPLERRNKMLLEDETSILNGLRDVQNKFCSAKEEAPPFREG